MSKVIPSLKCAAVVVTFSTITSLPRTRPQIDHLIGLIRNFFLSIYFSFCRRFESGTDFIAKISRRSTSNDGPLQTGFTVRKVCRLFLFSSFFLVCSVGIQKHRVSLTVSRQFSMYTYVNCIAGTPRCEHGLSFEKALLLLLLTVQSCLRLMISRVSFFTLFLLLVQS